MQTKANLTQQLQTLALQQNQLTQQLKNVEQSIQVASFALQTLEAVEKEQAEAAKAAEEKAEPTE